MVESSPRTDSVAAMAHHARAPRRRSLLAAAETSNATSLPNAVFRVLVLDNRRQRQLEAAFDFSLTSVWLGGGQPQAFIALFPPDPSREDGETLKIVRIGQCACSCYGRILWKSIAESRREQWKPAFRPICGVGAASANVLRLLPYLPTPHSNVTAPAPPGVAPDESSIVSAQLPARQR